MQNCVDKFQRGYYLMIAVYFCRKILIREFANANVSKKLKTHKIFNECLNYYANCNKQRHQTALPARHTHTRAHVPTHSSRYFFLNMISQWFGTYWTRFHENLEKRTFYETWASSSRKQQINWLLKESESILLHYNYKLITKGKEFLEFLIQLYVNFSPQLWI